MYVCICETMPCVDAVFMYSMLVVDGDSWWSIPLKVCAVWSYPFQVLLQIDASSGFEMETFEFQNILQTEDFPKCWVSRTFQYSRTKMPSRRSIGL